MYITYYLIMAVKSDIKVLHYPNLDTVLMVEEFIRNNSGEYRKKALWEHLPRKVMYQTFNIILDYLSDSGKIAFDKDGKIAWIWNPELVRRFLSEEALTIR
jgi:tryptophanase